MMQGDDAKLVAAMTQLETENLIRAGQLDARAGRQLDSHRAARNGRDRLSTG